MADFNCSISIVLKHEGGFADNPDDKGGPTNFGITMATLEDYLGSVVSAQAVRSMTKDMACQIYRSKFWNALRLDEVTSQPLASVIFDMAVLRGVPTIAREIQEIVNVVPDGVIGPVSIRAINAYPSPNLLALALIKRSQLDLLKIALRDHSQDQFETNWMERTQDLLDLII